jgi:hypothetical protein
MLQSLVPVMLALVLGTALLTTTGPAEAQYGVALAQDDVAWEERKEPYDGGVLRPGMQLEGHVNWVTFGGVAGFVIGWAFGFYLVSEHGAVAVIPFAGGLLAEVAPLTVIGAILQPLGVAAFIYGLATPRMYVVYDAPVGSPSISTARVDFTPGAPGADLGASLVGTF